jgi:hypothetical protein
MLIASVGSAVAADLGLTSVWADNGSAALSFGTLEPLVSLMQETPADSLLPRLVEKIHGGTELRTLVAAAALANARTFGGQDYIGYHTLMALPPAYEMAKTLPEKQRPLPVLKVLYRNTGRIQDKGGRTQEALHPVQAAEVPKDVEGGELLRRDTRSADLAKADQTFAALAQGPVGEAFNHLQYAVQDEVDVHRVVLAWRSWALLDLTGKEQAQTLLRQSVRYCADAEAHAKQRKQPEPEIRRVLPRLLDQYQLLSKPLGSRKADDAWVEHLSRVIYESSRDQAADAVAAALAEGMAPEAIGEAMSLAANRLVLCDPGRQRPAPTAGSRFLKGIGSVHGDSVGVHASDAANAWRNIARVSNHRNTVASLIVGAYHTAGQARGLLKEPYPLPEHRESVRETGADALLGALNAAIRERDQARASALVQRCSELGCEPRSVFDVLLRYAISEEGALHAEKYYRTVSEEFVQTRAAFRWRQLVALARVTASEYGEERAPGYQQACELLHV